MSDGTATEASQGTRSGAREGGNHMSFYVSRIKETGERAWVGPIRSAAQAQREARAWIDCGRPAEVVESSTEVKREVRAWQRAMDVKHGRVKVYGKAG